jgi:hypothetical protein
MQIMMPILLQIIYAKRSKLGLVGSSFDISRDDWSSRETTIGPGIDSYYEYLLKVCDGVWSTCSEED